MPLLFLLAACAPQVAPGPVRPVLEGVGFFPALVGLEWTYLPEGEALGAPPYRVRVEGLEAFAGREALRFHSFGRGQDRVYYRSVGGQGVELLGFRDPSARVVFNPPILEYPPEGLLAPGYRWGGTVAVQVDLLAPGREERLTSGRLEYGMEVLEAREVRVPAGGFRVYRIRQTYRDERGETLYEVWFAPRVGEVRTREGWLLVERNFR